LDRGDREAASDDRPTVIFLHIGKTGGMTLRTVLNRQFPPSEILVLRSPDRAPRNQRLRREDTVQHFASLPESVRRRARLIEGHTIFGVHEFVPRPSTYLTLLRHPVALTISQYRFVARKPRHWLHSEVASNETTLDAYVRSGISLETDNSQTRALSGDTSTPFGACTEGMLEVAKSNVDKYFAMLGITERFDESLVLLRSIFGWSNAYYVPSNVAPKKERREPIANSTLRLIEEQNEIDMELYRWASTRFEHAIGSIPSFASDLRRFRRSNMIYRPRAYLTHTVPRWLYLRSKRGLRAGRGKTRPQPTH
jgi:hypothetical protein